jgi:hypothetical protein
MIPVRRLQRLFDLNHRTLRFTPQGNGYRVAFDEHKPASTDLGGEQHQ